MKIHFPKAEDLTPEQRERRELPGVFVEIEPDDYRGGEALAAELVGNVREDGLGLGLETSTPDEILTELNECVERILEADTPEPPPNTLVFDREPWEALQAALEKYARERRRRRLALALLVIGNVFAWGAWLV